MDLVVSSHVATADERAAVDAVLGPPPAGWVTAGRRPVDSLERVVGDYLAGMTDRFAQGEYRRLFLPSLDL